MTGWQRPAGPLNIWKVVDGFEVLKDGTKKPTKFYIQEVPDTIERKQEVIDLMINHFLTYEPMSKSLKIKDDPNGTEDFITMWNYGLEQKITVGCYKLNSVGEIGELVGANIVFIINDEVGKDFTKIKENFKSKSFLVIWNFFEYLLKKADVTKLYNVDKYIGSISLCVDSTYRGQKLGVYMLEARREIAKKYGLTATSTMFTAPTSQLQAKRAGFEEAYSVDYKDANDEKGNPLFPNIESQCVKIMMMRLP